MLLAVQERLELLLDQLRVLPFLDRERSIHHHLANGHLLVVLHFLSESRTGRAWKASREDPLAAELMGIPVNRVKITGAPIPFGGMKQSGLGREGSRHGLEAFTDLKYLCLDIH